MIVAFIPQGVHATAVVDLGDRDDGVGFFHDAAGWSATISGGPGNDKIFAPGYRGEALLPNFLNFLVAGVGSGEPPMSAALGPSARPRSTLAGGPGADKLFGSMGDDNITPGGGRDYVEGSLGDDRIRAEDGSVDYIHCLKGRDSVSLDRRDFVFGRCGTIRPRRPHFASLLWAGNSYDSGYFAESLVACSADSAAACKGAIGMSVRGGRRLLSRRFSIRPGAVQWFGRAISDPTERTLERRGLRVTTRAVSAAGRIRLRSHVFDIDVLPDEDGN